MRVYHTIPYIIHHISCILPYHTSYLHHTCIIHTPYIHHTYHTYHPCLTYHTYHPYLTYHTYHPYLAYLTHLTYLTYLTYLTHFTHITHTHIPTYIQTYMHGPWIIHSLSMFIYIVIYIYIYVCVCVIPNKLLRKWEENGRRSSHSVPFQPVGDGPGDGLLPGQAVATDGSPRAQQSPC